MKVFSSLLCGALALSMTAQAFAQNGSVALEAQKNAGEVFLSLMNSRAAAIKERMDSIATANKLLSEATYQQDKAIIWLKPADYGDKATFVAGASLAIALFAKANPNMKALEPLNNILPNIKLMGWVAALALPAIATAWVYGTYQINTTRAQVEYRKRELELAKESLNTTRQEFAEAIRRAVVPLGATINQNIVSFEGVPNSVKYLPGTRFNVNSMEFEK